MALSPRSNEMIKKRSREKLVTSRDPIERLRLKCLERGGASGIKGLSRYVIHMVSKSLSINFISVVLKGSWHKICIKYIATACRTFRIFDDDGNKKLNFDEFSTGLNDYGLFDISIDEKRAMFAAFDKDKSGQISFDELLERIRVSIDLFYSVYGYYPCKNPDRKVFVKLG